MRRCRRKVWTLLLISALNPGGSDGKASAYNVGDLGSIPGSGRSPGEGNGNPLQYSSLENPINRGAWQATVHGVAKSRTWLSDFIFTFTKWLRDILFLPFLIHSVPFCSLLCVLRNLIVTILFNGFMLGLTVGETSRKFRRVRERWG